MRPLKIPDNKHLVDLGNGKVMLLPIDDGATAPRTDPNDIGGTQTTKTGKNAALGLERPLERQSMIFSMPIRTVSEANVREHWAQKAKRTAYQRNLARVSTAMAQPYDQPIAVPPLTIILTRIGKRNLDTDNLSRSFKAIRDGIADAIGCDDGDDRLTWVYAQAIGKVYSVRVTIE